LLKERYDVPAGDIEAALGPSIGSCCYEVREDVTRPLLERWGKLAESSIRHEHGKSFLDLRRLNQDILAGAGIPPTQVFQIGPCTSCAAQEFFSYRREGKETGRQMSFIGWQS
jgi:copper oxidase (laccase) domain-containing protein